MIDSSLRMSPLQASLKKMRLTHNMRARSDPLLSEFLLRIGYGKEEVVDQNFIRISDDMIIPYTDANESMKKLIDVIFLSLDMQARSSEYMIFRAILSMKNECVDMINSNMIERFPEEEHVYYSFDSAEDDTNNNYPIEFLYTLNLGDLPPHLLKLKVGCPIIPLRNIDPANGLCNGTRLICRSFQRNVIDAEITVGEHAGKRIFLPRIPLCPSDDDMFSFQDEEEAVPYPS
jgi:ATP-dependent DNA helicase PIF1